MKKTLPHASKHTPAIASFGHFLYLAYTGTDKQGKDKQLHVLRSSDEGKTFPTQWDWHLNESSISGPSLAVFNNCLYIAWTGTDQYKLLNVMYTDNPDSPFKDKVTILENSPFGPALAVFKNQLFIAWIGVDPEHSYLNVIPSSDGHFDRTRKKIIPLENSVATPGFASVSAGPTEKLFLSWTGTDQWQHLNLLPFEDGENFTSSDGKNVKNKIILNPQAYEARGVHPLHDLTSSAGPALLTNYHIGQDGDNPRLFLAWTNKNGHLGSTSFQIPNPGSNPNIPKTGIKLNSDVTTYQEASSTGPALGQLSEKADTPFIAWINNDQINLALLSDLTIGEPRPNPPCPVSVTYYKTLLSSGYAPVNGLLRMYYEIHGTNTIMTTTPLITIHPAWGLANVFPQLCRNRRLIAVELQGHGRTADIDRPLTFEQSANDIAALMNHLHIKQADFFGESDGGIVAMMMAVRHPNLVRSVAIYESPLLKVGEVTAPQTPANGVLPTPDGYNVQFLRENYERVAPDPKAWPKLLEKVRKTSEWRGFSHDELQSIKVPVLIASGDHGFFSTHLPSHVLEAFQLIPHAQLAVIPDAGHFVLNDDPEKLLPIVATFLDQPTSTIPFATAKTGYHPGVTR